MKLKKIEKIKTKHYKGIIHDLTVEDNHSYNINGIIVHNSICSTRLNTGFGVPLFTSIADCAGSKNDGVMLIADGGIKHPGDIAKAIAAGADMCMLGKMLAGTNLAGGACFDKNKELLPCKIDPTTNTVSFPFQLNEDEICYKGYHGMASKVARQGIMSKASIEGVSGVVPYIGTTEDLLDNIKLNLQASLSYNGSRNWAEFKKRVKIIRITNSSWEESKTHVS